MESEFVDSASTTAYAPLIQNYNYNWISGPAMQNAGTSTQTLNVSFRNSSGSQCDPDSYPNVAAHYSIMDAAPPGNPPCSSTASARISSVNSVEANINQLLPGTFMATNYPAVGVPGYAVVAPVWYKSWSSGIVILNTSDSNNATVQVEFYPYGGGTPVYSTSQVLSPLQQWIVQSFPGDAGFVGSAVVNSTVPVAVSSNHMPSSTGDGIMSIIGIHR